MTKQRIMLIAGGSDLAGSEIDGTEDSAYNREHAFGNVLAEKMGYTPINIAVTGATNPTIARSVLEWFDANYNADTMDVFVTVGWTESSRMEVPVNHRCDYRHSNPAIDWFPETMESYLRINFGWPGNDDEKKFIAYYHEFMAKNTTYLEILSINCVLQLQYFFKMHQVPYVMCNTLHMVTSGKHLDFYIKQVDQTRYYEFSNNEGFYWKYKNAGYTNPKAKYWHHDETPHLLHADALYQFLN